MPDPMTDADQTTRDALAEESYGPDETTALAGLLGLPRPIARGLLATDWWRTHVTEPLENGRRAERWREDALPVLAQLQELGRALDIPLGQSCTGPLAVEAVEKLKAERDAALAQVAAVKALLPTWTEATCQTDGAPCSWHRVAAECAGEVTAALSDPGPLAEHDRRVPLAAADECERTPRVSNGREWRGEAKAWANRLRDRAERVGRGEA